MLKIKFLAQNYLPVENRLVYRLLSRHFELVQSEDPDYIVDFGASDGHVKYDDCVKIALLGENSSPDFNAFDYVIGSDRIGFGDRYLCNPLFVKYETFGIVESRLSDVTDEYLLARKFCSFVVSNSLFGDPMRKLFFDRLSKYKKVDSGGRWMNNVGGPVKDKLEFCRGYKFNIAFENSSYPGYTTEKVMEAFAAGTMPIYYGDPNVGEYFNPAAMVVVKDKDDIERAVEEIIALDKDDAAYLAKLKTPCMEPGKPEQLIKELEDFLVHIFEQPLDKAKRRAQYGHQAMMREYHRKLYKLEKAAQMVKRFLPI